MLTISDEIAIKAADYLSANDPILKPVIARTGPCTIRKHTDYYRELVEAIIGQQLSVKAAASIQKRFLGLFGDRFPAPQQIVSTDIEQLRGAGLSYAKAAYIQSLAQHMLDGKVEFSRFDTMDNAAIISELTAVKGIGEWTAHMFLMWCMGRTNVLPYGDLGVRNGIQQLYALSALPDKTAIEQIAAANHWHPYESIASWYVWQSLDNAPVS